MGREEVQDQLNDAEKYDICAIDILSHYRKYSSGKMMMKVSGLHGLRYEAFESDDVKIDYPDTLAIYLLGTCIGVKSSRNLRYPREAK